MGTPRRVRAMTRFLAHLGPRGVLILVMSALWIGFGWGTVEGYSGRPADAPHLLIPAAVRGAAWIAAAAVASGFALPRPCIRRRRHRHRWALITLGIPPSVWAGSYSWSWVMSWAWLDALIPGTPGELLGSRSSGYTSLTWWALMALVVCGMWAPASWTSLARAHERDAAIERGAE